MKNQQLKKRWIKALRSGQYKQGRGTLRSDPWRTGDATYCCLGVLCEVAAGYDGLQALVPGLTREGNRYQYGREGSSCGFLSEALCKRVGLTEDEQDKLSDLNDSKRMSFKWIASYIERYL